MSVGPGSHEQPSSGLTDRLVETLHVEALLLADEARAYFDDVGRVERDRLAPIDRVLFSCESLKVTTRLMHVVAWLLMRRGSRRGVDEALSPQPLADAVPSDEAAIAVLPSTAQQLIAASRDLHARVHRLESDTMRSRPGPARDLIGRLERAL